MSYLLGASQGEEQVQCSLSKMKVLLHAEAHLQGGQQRGKNGEPSGHLQPRVPILIHLTELLSQMQSQDTHLLAVRGKDRERWKRRLPPLGYLLLSVHIALYFLLAF